jgi:hypothetical protein
MPKKRKVLREQPPNDLIDGVCRLAGWSGRNDGKWIYNTDPPEGKEEELFGMLWPYFVPCWAKRYLKKDPSFINLMTILKIILPGSGRQIETQIRKSKLYPFGLTWYRLAPVVKITEASFQLTWD